MVVVFFERLARRVSDAECLEQRVGLGVVGETPRFPTRSRDLRKAASKQLSQRIFVFEESIDSLRTTLVLADELRDMPAWWR